MVWVILIIATLALLVLLWALLVLVFGDLAYIAGPLWRRLFGRRTRE